MPEYAASRAPLADHRRLEVNHLHIHYVHIKSPERPLILLHGIGMDWRVWQALSRRLSPRFDLYMLDLRGHGSSEKPVCGYSLAHYAADIEEFVEALGLSDAILVGSSLGAMVAATVEAPRDLISHRVLVDPPITGGPVRDPQQFEDILQLKHRPEGELADYLQNLNPQAGRFLLRTMSQMWHAAADGVITEMLAQPHDYFRIEDALPLIESPTLILRAEPSLGGVLSREQAQKALALLPHGQLIDVPDAGHAIHAVRPAEFIQSLLHFTESPT